MQTILIIEDDNAISRNLSVQLSTAGYNALTAPSASAAMQALQAHRADLCLLDVNLPDMDGYALCQEIRKRYRMPIVYLTVRDDEESLIRGLEAGGDDYVVKPFSFPTLKSRIMAHLRRVHMEVEKDCFRYVFDDERHLFFLSGKQLDLTKTEYELLRLLIDAKGCLVTREQMLAHIWDDQGIYVEPNTLSVNMSRLRKKVATQGVSPIETVWGFGYRWREDV